MATMGIDPMDPKAMTVKNRPQKRWKTIGKPEENGDLMRVYGGLMGFNVIYPLVNVYIKLWNITMILIGKSTISIRASFQFANC